MNMDSVIKVKNKKVIVVITVIVCTLLLSRLMFYLLWILQSDDKTILGFINGINKWDAGWYSSICSTLFANYPAPADLNSGQAQWAFFLFVEIIVRLIGNLLNYDNYYFIGLVLNTILMIPLCFVSYKYVILTRNSEEKAFEAIILLCLGPFSFYTAMLYTEAMFILLLVSCMYFMKTERYILMGICGAMLSGTRNLGVFFCFVLLIYWLELFFKQKNYRFTEYLMLSLKNYRLVLGTFLIPLGLFMYMQLLHVRIGDSFGFIHVEKGWWKENIGIFKVVFDAMTNAFPPDFRAVIILFSFLLIAFLIIEHRFDEAFLPTFVIFVSATSTLISVPRYIWSTYTVTLAFIDVLAQMKRSYRYLIILICIIYEMLLFKAWLDGNGSVY